VSIGEKRLKKPQKSMKKEVIIRRIASGLAALLLGALALGTARAQNQSLTWGNGAANSYWDTTSGNWTGASTTWGNSTTQPDSATFGSTGVGTVTLNANIDVSNITFSATGYTIATNGTSYTLTPYGTSPTFTTPSGGTAVIAAPIAGTAPLTVAGSGTLIINNTNSTYGGSLTVNGATLVLTNAANTTDLGLLNGSLTISNGGTVIAGNNEPLGLGGGNTGAGVTNITINGGTLEFTNSAGAGGTEATNITLNAGTISGNPFDVYVVRYNSALPPPAVVITNVASSISSVISASMNLRMTNANDNSTNFLVFNVAQGTAPGGIDLIVSGQITATSGGGLIKNGAGTLDLADATNTYPGGTTVNGGLLLLTNLTTNPVGSGTIGGTLTINSGATVIATNATANYWPLGYKSTSLGSYVNNLFINGGTLEFSDGTVGASGLGATNITMTGGTITNITGTQPFDYYNSTATIAVINTLSASTTATISSGFRPRFASTTTLTLNVAQGTVPSGIDLAISGPIAYSATTSFASLIKAGAGTAQLSGANNYVAATTVNAGRLTLSGGSEGNTAITVNGGTFGVQPGSATTINAGTTTAGTAGATLTLDANTIFDMTDGAISTFNLQQQASFATAGLTITGAVTLKFDLGNSSADKMAVTKAASVSGTVNVFLNTAQMTSPTAGTYNLITAASGLNSGTWEFVGSSGTTENVIVGSKYYPLTLNDAAGTVSVTVGAGTTTTAAQLVFTTQPGNTTVGTTMTAPVVQLETSGGAAVALSGVPITLSGLNGSVSVTVLTDSSGKATFSGLTMPTVTQTGLTLTATAGSLTVNSSSFNITPGTPNTLVVETEPSASVTAGGAFSTEPAVYIEDQYNNVVTTDNSSSVTVAVQTGTGPLTGTLTVTASSGVATFSALAAPTATQSGLKLTFNDTTDTLSLNDTTSITVTPATASKVVFTSTAVTTTAGVASGSITVQRQDQYGNATTSGSASVSLTSSSTGTVTYAPASPLSIANGSSSASFTYTDTEAGTPTITAASSGLTSGTQQETVNAASASKLVFTSTPATTNIAGVASAAITVQRQDAYGNPNTTDATIAPTLASTSTGTVTFTPASPLSIANGNSSATFTYTDTQAGTPTITVAYSGLTSGTQQETVNAAAANKLVFTSTAVTTAAGTASGTITVQSQDTYGNPAVPASTNYTLSSTSTGTVTFSPLTFNIATVSAGFTYMDTQAGTPTITAADTGLTSGTQQETVTPAGASKLVFTSSAVTVAAGTASGSITVQRQDPYSNPTTVGSTNVTLTSTSSGTVTFTPASPLTISGGSSSASFTYTDTKAGTPTITAAGTGLTSGTQVETVVPAGVSAASSVISATPTSIAADGASTSAITVAEEDAYGNNLTSSGTTPVLSASAGSLGSVTDNHNGTYSAVLTSATAVATASVTGTISSSPVGTSASVIFTAGSTNVLTTSSSPALISSNVVFTDTLSAVAPSTGTPSGTVQFLTNGVDFGGPVALSGVVATITNSTLARGTNSISAIYTGDTYFSGSTGTVSQVVDTPPAVNPVSVSHSVGAAVQVPFSELDTPPAATDAEGAPLTITAIDATTSPSGTPLTLDGTGVTNSTKVYVPASAADGDTFNYTVSDGYGGSTINTVTIHVTAATGQQTPGALSVDGSGNVHLTFYGVPGNQYYIQRSTTLSPPSWTDISGSPFTADATTGVITATDALGTGAAYYQLSTSP
jgi:autotransporter-associated beta strand protein